MLVLKTGSISILSKHKERVKVERDLSQFPNSPLGDVIFEAYQAHGEALAEHELELEFSVIFPSQELALKFGHMLLENGQKLSFSPYQGNAELPWEITAYPSMLLTYDNVNSYCQLLAEHSQAYQGSFDAWYCSALQLGQEQA